MQNSLTKKIQPKPAPPLEVGLALKMYLSARRETQAKFVSIPLQLELLPLVQYEKIYQISPYFPLAGASIPIPFLSSVEILYHYLIEDAKWEWDKIINYQSRCPTNKIYVVHTDPIPFFTRLFYFRTTWRFIFWWITFSSSDCLLLWSTFMYIIQLIIMPFLFFSPTLMFLPVPFHFTLATTIFRKRRQILFWIVPLLFLSGSTFYSFKIFVIRTTILRMFIFPPNLFLSTPWFCCLFYGVVECFTFFLKHNTSEGCNHLENQSFI